MEFEIKPVLPEDHDWLLDIVRGWGAEFIVTRGRKVYPTEIEGFYALSTEGERVGLVTFEVIGDQCEIVTLDAFAKWSGIGTALMDHVRQVVQSQGCKRLWLITTNDNVDAIRFYQKRGFRWAATHIGALEYSRQIKPTIPLTGFYDIPLHDEIEFEMMLD